MSRRVSRRKVQELKRVVVAGTRTNADGSAQSLARAAALALLRRSVSFGHERLAVLRLAMAVKTGAEVSVEHWAYCDEVVKRSGDSKLLTRLSEAAADAGKSHKFAIDRAISADVRAHTRRPPHSASASASDARQS